ncbi:hypothetical protein AA309_22185 [Microvirga vignae]|uniref:Uncharacterized protein n=1 Tax=Microvirga vignae TaxID=1225564 RepID=A0A0H1R7D0_9HYPH|nr:hypothetical protein [Microvirga vignae]KLK91155.1 hypothetical protein AA309_22185 [Microvirga vignae]
MNQDKVEAVAELLAKVGSNWYPERTRPALRTISKRHRVVAQLILAELDKLSDAEQDSESVDGSPSENLDDVNAFNFAGDDQLYVGAAVVYRPPGEKRAITCLIDRMEHGRAYLVPAHREIGWVSTQTLSLPKPEASGQ